MPALSERTLCAPPLGVVQETMLITLWARARESKRSDAIVRDEHAERVAAALPYDVSRFDGGWKSQVGVAVRDRWIDARVREHLDRHGETTIVNLGAGLDTRFLRLADDRTRWIEIDLPDAMAARRSLVPPSTGNLQIECDARAGDWIDRVAAESPRPTLLIAEGVLMFFERDEVMQLLDRFASSCPGATLIFDLIGPLMVRWPRLHDTLPRTRAAFRWGFRSRADLDSLGHHWSIHCARSMLDEAPERWRWMRACRYMPFLRRQFVVVHGQADP